MLKIAILAVLAVGALAQEPTLESSRKHLKDMLLQQCKKNNAEDKVPEIEEGIRTFVQCLQGLVNVQELNSEIEEAKPKGALDEVFKKYCAKTPQLKTCIHTLMDKFSPCVDVASREQFNSGKNTTDQLIDFICHKDGDRIALFIAEGGPECFRTKAEDIKTCADDLKKSFSDVESAKLLTISARCGKYDELTTCVVGKLETCTNPTPANMAESLFKYIRKGSPCNTALPPK